MATGIHHAIVYHEPGRFAGWPANYGLWAWGDEIVVGFTVGEHFYNGENAHAVRCDRPFVNLQARSHDGGFTWQTEPATYRTPSDKAVSVDEHVNASLAIDNPAGQINAPVTCPTPLDFTQPDFALMCARTGLKAGAVSWFYTSTDRCHTWDGPYALPDFGQTGIAARTDYLVDGPHSATFFLTAAKPDGEEGHVFCARTTDGGQSFSFVSWLTPEPAGYKIMPASIRLENGEILTALRCAEPTAEGKLNTIELYLSADDGATWELRSVPVPGTGKWGNPPAFIQLADGRLCLVYGYRTPPFGLRARLSSDLGHTWDDEIILRSDGGSHDLGYPRITQRPDGQIVCVYYYTDSPQSERYIAATLFQP